MYTSEVNIIILDWISSFLLMGSVWGWIYKRIYPLLDDNLNKSKIRFQAIKRLIRIKYGKNYSKLPAIQRQTERLNKFGVTKYTSFSTVKWLMKEENKVFEKLIKYNLATDIEKKYLKQNKQDMLTIGRIRMKYRYSKIFYRLKYIVMTLVKNMTNSIFTGKIGFIIFIIGFLGWNLAKFLTIINLISINANKI